MARPKSSALLEQMQANMRMAAQRAREREEENRIAEQEAIAAAMAEAEQAEEPEAIPMAAEPEPAEAVAIEQQQAEPETKPAEHVSQALPENERKIRSLSAVAVEVLKALIKARGFINVMHMDVQGPKGRVPYDTIRSAIKRLDKDGFFDERGVGNYGTLKGMRYVLNSELVSAFSAMQGDEEKESVISVKKIDKNPEPQSQNPYDHAELNAWREAGLSDKQIAAWQAEFSLEPELLATYMKWCAFDAEHNHADSPIKNLPNWFYSMLKKTGGYPKPNGYVSLEERRAAELEAIRAERRAQRHSETLAVQEEMDAGLKEYFDSLMAQGEASELYVELRGMLNDFTRRMEGLPGNPIFRSAMWAAFRQKIGL